MRAIQKQFEEHKKWGKKGFIPFITAGDPDIRTTLDILKVLAELDSTVIELGVPFTDPMADGPVIQASSKRALDRESPIKIDDILALVAEFRKFSQIPIVLFGYLNPFLSYGIERLAEESKKAGVDGFLITDVVDLEFVELSDVFDSQNIDMISLVAPTTTASRLKRILSASRGFVYAVSTRGVTGSGTDLTDAVQLVERVKSETSLPVAVGFGLSSRKDIEEIWEVADAAVVGSSIVRVIESAGSRGDCPGAVKRYVQTLLGSDL